MSNFEFTPIEAVELIKKLNFKESFTLPDIYGEEWTMTRANGAGAFGKKFFYHISKHPEEGISRLEGLKINNRAVYRYNPYINK
ncbi:DUF1413 domain-containing protein [Pseudobutyrivibrio ruminis]|nr:DUF1413 domain-containing protein [Pseudobutyrivibrio ruminis]